MKKLIVVGIAIAVMAGIAGVATAAGNGWIGYHKNNVFVGTGSQWCQQKFGWSEAQCADYLGIYANDKLVMKWNEEWNRGNDENWANPPYDAWLNNEWNGMIPGGSGTTEHFKTKWVGLPCNDTNKNWADGGYCIWGQFEAIQDFYGPGVPDVWAHAIPNGFGN